LYYVDSNLKGQTYKEFLQFAFNICDEFILVRRYDIDLASNALSTLDALEPFLIEMNKKSSWPGTTLLEQTADIYRYKTVNEAQRILSTSANSLFSWVQPSLPEDLCFVKKQIPWAENTAHEERCIFRNLSDSELLQLQKIRGLQIKRLLP
jgi:hypothetical protein